MSRQLKFRGKREDNGEWVFGAFIPDALEGNNSDLVSWGFIRRYNKDIGKMETIEVDRETVGQFTGLKDMNGVEIYEGDRLKRIGDDGDEIFIIEWNEQSGGFNLNYIYFGEIYDLEELWPDSQVIGNIHEQEEAND